LTGNSARSLSVFGFVDILFVDVSLFFYQIRGNTEEKLNLVINLREEKKHVG